MQGNTEPRSRGHLNPGAREVSFDRFELGDALSELVRHVWVVRWSVPDGETRSQRVLAYPTYNAVFQASEGHLYGADPRLSVRNLTGTSWAVGVLFRPAAGVVLTPTPPAELLGSREPFLAAPAAAVAHAMEPDPYERAELVSTLRRWLLPTAKLVDHRGRLINEICRAAEEDDTILRTADLASRVGISARTLQRVVKRQIGVSPKWLIECRRLQQAATELGARPHTQLASFAAELGFSDYSHFSRRYRTVLGETPEQTRALALRAATGASLSAGTGGS